MSSKRCSIGCESWPNNAKYNTCPICGEPTRLIDKDQTVTEEEASSILLHALFEEFYEKRCAERGIPADGPWPSPSVVA